MPRKINIRACVTCGRVGSIHARDECSACYQHRRKRGAPRHIDPLTGRVPRVPEERLCITCDRVREVHVRGECYACRSYRRRHGVARPYGAQDGRPIGSAGAARLRVGPLHNQWKGDGVTYAAGYLRARRVVPDLGTCELCSNAPAYDRHHWNRDETDNRLDNLIRLCRSCHQTLHRYAYGVSGRTAMRRAESAGYSRANRLLPVLGDCEHCGRPAQARHHWDRDPRNNALETLVALCRGCHGALHTHGYVSDPAHSGAPPW